MTDLKMGQCAELSQWKPLFFCPVRMSQMMMACGSSLVSIRGLKVTTYLKHSAVSAERTQARIPSEQGRCSPLTRREVDEGDALMAEPLNLFELLTTPQCNTPLVEGGQVGAFRRPAHVRLRPALHKHTAAFNRVVFWGFFLLLLKLSSAFDLQLFLQL